MDKSLTVKGLEMELISWPRTFAN